MPDIALEAVTRTYGRPPGQVHALRGIDLVIEAGSFVSIIGPSGAGKSTVLNLLTLLDTPTMGRVLVDGPDPAGLSPRALARLRSATFGFVFQGFHLMEARSVIENVMLGLRYRHVPNRPGRDAALAALEQVGLADRADELARNLSGGQRQRVAIARALVAGAPVLVADEPTGDLDSTSASAITRILQDVASTGRTVILVTHSNDVAAVADRTITIRDGHIEHDTLAPGQDEQATPDLVEDPPDTPTREHHSGSDRVEGPAGDTGPERPEHSGRDGGLVAVGRDSSLSLPDLLRDAWANLASVPSRMLALVLAVALGVGLATATFGLASSASAQVSATFDAQRNRQVSASLDTPDQDLATYVQRASQVRGIDTIGAATDTEDALVGYRDATAEPGTRVYAITGQYPAAARQSITWAPGTDHLDTGQALVGASLAESLQIGPLFAGPVLVIDGKPRTVVGIVTDSPLEPDAMRAVMITDTDPARNNPLITDQSFASQVRILSGPGAAQQVAHQLPLALDPLERAGITITAPPDPASSRAQIESTLATTLTVLSVVAVLAAVISLMNSMSMSVMTRTREFGLRRALGARASHLRLLVLTEALLIGIAGGTTGLFLGLLGVLATTIARGWAPVFDPVLAPTAIAAGIIVAMTAGTIAGTRAAHIQPIEALRE
jgi:macrolide transport system ATP-binding/permease protein